MARTDREVAVLDRNVCRNPTEHLCSDRCWNSAIIHGDQHRRAAALVFAERESLCVNALCDASAWFSSTAIATEPHRIIRRDIPAGCSNREQRTGFSVLARWLGPRQASESAEEQCRCDKKPAGECVGLHGGMDGRGSGSAAGWLGSQ